MTLSSRASQPRTRGAVMKHFLFLVSLLVSIGILAAQEPKSGAPANGKQPDKPEDGKNDGRTPAVDESICPKFKRCKKEHVKERKACPGCNKAKIPANYERCGSCAHKEKVCPMCGRPKTASKAGKCKNIDEAVARITQEELRKVLYFLADDKLEGRCAGSPGNDQAADYIAKIWQDAGLKPGNGGGYFQPFDCRGRPARNIIGVLPGERANEIIVLGGHYDHVGVAGKGPPGQQLGGAVGGDNIFNGADDNASGATLVCVIGKILAQSGLKPKRTIVFMEFSGEEWGLVGSRAYARSPIFPKESHLAMVDTDMVGRLRNAVDIGGLGTEKGQDFEDMVKRNAGRVGLPYNPKQSSRIGGGDTDSSSFRDIGIPVMYLYTGNHPDYHRPTDHPDKINFAGLEQISRAVAYLIWEMANCDRRWEFQNN